MKIPVLFYIFLFIEICTALVGGFRYRNLPRPLRILEWLIIVSIFEVIVQVTLAYFKIHNAWTMHFITLIEIVFVFFMCSLWIKQRQSRLMLLFCLSAFVVLWIISKFTFEPLSLLDGWTSTISMILQIIFSTLLLVDVVKESDIIWTDDPRFWIATGIIIYSAGSLFWFAFFNKMLQISPERLKQVFYLNWILSIISNLLYARGFLCKR
ncbi:MAG: hypothetical protein ABR936_06890 [Bacteroidota bacterium]|jgi:hypothetical protein